jgi:hypothetical protein
LAATGQTAAAEENIEKAATFNPNFDLAVVALAELNSNQ